MDQRPRQYHLASKIHGYYLYINSIRTGDSGFKFLYSDNSYIRVIINKAFLPNLHPQTSSHLLSHMMTN